MSAKGSKKGGADKPASPSERFQREESDLMKRVARQERGNSEFDTHDLPLGDRTVGWRYFNADMYGSDRKW